MSSYSVNLSHELLLCHVKCLQLCHLTCDRAARLVAAAIVKAFLSETELRLALTGRNQLVAEATREAHLTQGPLSVLPAPACPQNLESESALMNQMVRHYLEIKIKTM